MKKLALCFGSESEGDKLALEICSELGGRAGDFDILKCDNPFDIRSHMEKSGEIVIIDVVKGLKKARLFDGADAFARTRSVTAHDLDLCSMLKILEAAEKRRFRIIGVPFGSEKTEAAREAGKLLASL